MVSNETLGQRSALSISNTFKEVSVTQRHLESRREETEILNSGDGFIQQV